MQGTIVQYSTVVSSQAEFVEAVEKCQQKARVHDEEWAKMRLDVAREREAASQDDELHDWIQRRRAVDKLQMDFWQEYAGDIEDAKVSLAKVVAQIRDGFKPDVVDLLKFDDWVEGIVEWYEKRVEKQTALDDAEWARKKAEEEQGVAASQGTISAARPRYSKFFNLAAGRPVDAGPPGATCQQPQDLDVTWGNNELVEWWLNLGGYSSCNQVDENGWTPLHHCVESMVHWDQAWKIGKALIETMAASQDGETWLRAKTLKGQPPHRTALHMLANNSDRALKKAELAEMLARAASQVDPLDDQGRTPLMHAVGTGLLDVAKALVRAGADPTKQSYDGRNIANRCKGSSGAVTRWVKNELRIEPAKVDVTSRYREEDAVSLSRQARYDAKKAMTRAEELAASQGGAPAASSSGAASQGGAPAAGAPKAPMFRARSTPTSPAAPERKRWAWFWDAQRQRWSWYWRE